MTSLIKAAAQNAVKNIVNGLLAIPDAYSSNWCNTATPNFLSRVGKRISVGTTVSGVLKTVLEITGAGECNLLLVSKATAGAFGQISIRVTIDETVAFYLPMGSLELDTLNNVIGVIGSVAGPAATDTATVTGGSVLFKSSFKVEVASQTGGVNPYYCCVAYKTF